jgi:hypothetical protein
MAERNEYNIQSRTSLQPMAIEESNPPHRAVVTANDSLSATIREWSKGHFTYDNCKNNLFIMIGLVLIKILFAIFLYYVFFPNTDTTIIEYRDISDAPPIPFAEIVNLREKIHDTSKAARKVGSLSTIPITSKRVHSNGLEVSEESYLLPT